MMQTIQALEPMKAKAIEPKASAEVEWGQLLEQMMSPTLFKFAGSWWNGGNIPGKKVQVFAYIGGLGNYEKTCREAISTWKGFDVLLDDQVQHVSEKTTKGTGEVDLVKPISS
jgi:hypothetical protein